MVLSPHLDDGVFSAFAALSAPGRSSSTLATVFTEPAPEQGAQWSQACGFADATSEFTHRRQEDLVACQALGVRCMHLGASAGDPGTLRRSLMRAFGEFDETHGDILLLPAGAGTATQPGAARRVLCRMLRRPAGCAAHGEHESVRDMGMSIIRELGLKRWGFYLENPYVWNDSIPGCRQMLESRCGTGLRVVQLVPDAAAKLRAADYYLSQAAPILGRRASFRRKTLAHPEVYLLAFDA
jgi:hypothetical protein